MVKKHFKKKYLYKENLLFNLFWQLFNLIAFLHFLISFNVGPLKIILTSITKYPKYYHTYHHTQFFKII